MGDETTPERDGAEVKIDWVVPAETIPQYVTHMLVQHTDQEFLLYLFNVRPPVFAFISPEDFRRQVEAGDIRLHANLVSAVVITADRIPSFIEALTTNWERYQASFAASGEGADNADSAATPTIGNS